MKEIGNRIESFRDRMHLTQASLAEISGVSERTIRNIERGAEGTSIGNLTKVADALGLELKLSVKKMSNQTRLNVSENDNS